VNFCNFWPYRVVWFSSKTKPPNFCSFLRIQ
jgi:hypothetical protein